MKRLLSTVLLCMLVSMSFAQKKAVKEARKAMEDNKLSDARQLLKPALTDPETANDPDTWKLAGDIEHKAFENEAQKLSQRQEANEQVLYTSLYNFYEPYLKMDSLAQIPNKKGKVDDKYRKLIAPIISTTSLYYINGGVFYNKQKDYAKASEYFERYWNMPQLNMFKDGTFPLNVNDTTMQTVKYYAVISAIQGKDHPRAIRYLNRLIEEPSVPTDVYSDNEIYELLANQYLQMEDSVKFMEIVEIGAKKFPKSKFFVPTLINEYIKKGNMDQALVYLDQAILNDPESSCELYSVKASIYTQEEEFDKSFESYEKALAADENCERALDGLSIAYIVNAQNLKDKAAQETGSRKEQTDIDNQAKELYRKAYPILERLRVLQEARSADKHEIKSTLYKLRNAYYNLNMNDEYEVAEKAYEALGE